MASDRSEFMIARSSIAFEDFLGSSIAPQVMPPCPATLCDIPENSKSPCWFIKDLGGGPIMFLLSFGYVLEWVKSFLALSQSI